MADGIIYVGMVMIYLVQASNASNVHSKYIVYIQYTLLQNKTACDALSVLVRYGTERGMTEVSYGMTDSNNKQ